MTTLEKSSWRNRIAKLFILALCIIEPHCEMHIADLTEDDPLRITIHQGVAGRVWFQTGDLFWGGPLRSTPVKREVLVHTLTRSDSVLPPRAADFFTQILTSFAGKSSSNDSGFYQISLPPGHYSVFVREDTLLYAGSCDGQGYFQPVLVKPDSVSWLDIKIHYQVLY
jgi:hypothetical protein